MRNTLYIIMLFFLTCVFVDDIFALETSLVLNTSNAPPNSTEDHRGIGDRVVTEAFKRIGIKVRILKVPSERALINANNGIEDGNFARIEGIEAQYPNLIMVSEEITRFEFVVFSKKDNLKPAGWRWLKPYNVGIVTGWKILENNIRQTKYLITVKDEKILFGLLKADKADIVIYDKMQGLTYLKDIDETGIKYSEPPLAVRNMYIYLNKRHKALIPKLTEAIRDIKRDGTYKNIIEEVINNNSR